MNKNLFKICFVAALLISANAAYASNISSATSLGGGTFSPSNKVNIGVVATITDYAAESKHLSGNRIMGTNNLDPKMYYTTAAVGASATVPGSSTAGYTAWTTL